MLIVLGKYDLVTIDHVNKFGMHMGLAWHVINLMKLRKERLEKIEDINDIYVMRIKLEGNQESNEKIQKLRGIVESNIQSAFECLNKSFENKEQNKKLINNLIHRFCM